MTSARTHLDKLRINFAIKLHETRSKKKVMQIVSRELSTISTDSIILVSASGDFISRLSLVEIDQQINDYQRFGDSKQSDLESDIININLNDVDKNAQQKLLSAYFLVNWCRENLVVPIKVEHHEPGSTLIVGICNIIYIKTVDNILKSRLSKQFLQIKYNIVDYDFVLEVIAENLRLNLIPELPSSKSDDSEPTSAIQARLVEKKRLAENFDLQKNMETERKRLAITFSEEDNNSNAHTWLYLSGKYQSLSEIEKNFLFTVLGALAALPFGIYSSICGAGSLLSVKTGVSSKSKLILFLCSGIFYTLFYFGGLAIINPLSRYFSGLNLLDERTGELRTAACLKELRTILHDEGSLRVQDISHDTAAEPKDSSYQYTIYITFRAKNAFNAFRLGKYTCNFKADGDLVSNWMDNE